MRSLFLKVFLWFWLAMALVVLSLVVSIMSTQPEEGRMRWLFIMDRSVSVYAQTAAEVYERMGEAELSGYIRRMNDAARFESFLFDQRSELLSPQPASPEVKKLASQVIASGTGQREFSESHFLVGQKALGPSGRAYVLVAAISRDGRFPPPGPLMFLGSEPHSFALRWPRCC